MSLYMILFLLNILYFIILLITAYVLPFFFFGLTHYVTVLVC